ncbi:hypothetical protein D3C81_1370060 [compost metagenome]
MSSGSSKSTSALSEKPVVFFSRYLWRILSASALLARVSLPSWASCSSSAAWLCRKAATLAGSSLSTTVPSASTRRRPARVL